jgi:nicotinamide riboside kinase
VEEYARKYLYALERPYEQHDLLHIALSQSASEQQCNATACVCDTDIHNIRIWSEIKYNSCSLDLVNIATKSYYDLAIVTAPNKDWEADGLREYPEYAQRLWLHKYYIADAIARGQQFSVVQGSAQEMLIGALDACQRIALFL